MTVSTRTKFIEIERLIGLHTEKEEHKKWCDIMGRLWSAFGEDPKIIDKLYGLSRKIQDGINGEWWLKQIDNLIGINSNSDYDTVRNKKHIIAFDNLMDVPILLIDGRHKEQVIRTFVDWETRTEEKGRSLFSIIWREDDMIRSSHPYNYMQLVKENKE